MEYILSKMIDVEDFQQRQLLNPVMVFKYGNVEPHLPDDIKVVAYCEVKSGNPIRWVIPVPGLASTDYITALCDDLLAYNEFVESRTLFVERIFLTTLPSPIFGELTVTDLNPTPTQFVITADTDIEVLLATKSYLEKSLVNQEITWLSTIRANMLIKCVCSLAEHNVEDCPICSFDLLFEPAIAEDVST